MLAQKKRKAGDMECAEYCVLLVASARGDAAHEAFVGKCREHCDSEVHDHCLQMRGTRHITLAKGRATASEAEAIRFSNDDKPVRLRFAKLKNWPACLALTVDDATAADVDQVVQTLELPAGFRRETAKTFHYSLFRGFGWGPRLKKEIPKMREATASLDAGSIDATAVVVKVVGADYDTARTVCTFPPPPDEEQQQ